MKPIPYVGDYVTLKSGEKGIIHRISYQSRVAQIFFFKTDLLGTYPFDYFNVTNVPNFRETL